MSLTKSPQYFAQYYFITRLFCVLRLYHPFWALQRRPCHCFTETVVPRSVLIIKTHQQGPFTMAIISSPSSRTTLPPSCGIKNGAWRTNISSGHNYVWWYSVSLTIELPGTHLMCFDVCMRFLTVLHTKFCTTVHDDQGTFRVICSWRLPWSSGTLVLGLQDFCVQYWFRSRSPTQTVIWHYCIVLGALCTSCRSTKGSCTTCSQSRCRILMYPNIIMDPSTSLKSPTNNNLLPWDRHSFRKMDKSL